MARRSDVQDLTAEVFTSAAVVTNACRPMSSRRRISRTALHVYVDDADAIYARAVEAGAVTRHPPTDQPYGDREAAVKHPTGNQWYIATHPAAPERGHRPQGFRTVTPYVVDAQNVFFVSGVTNEWIHVARGERAERLQQ